MTTRAEVVAEARTWIGSGYAHQHRAKGYLVDCAGLIIGVARNLGLVPPGFDVTGYSRVPNGDSLIVQCDRFMTRIDRNDMQPGDVIAGRYEDDPQHMAILGDYLYGGLSMIHALNRSDGKGGVVEHRLDPRMRFRLVQAYALPGVE